MTKTKNTGGLLAVYKLYNRFYIKSFIGPFFSFVFPVIILAILGSLMEVDVLFPGILAMTSMSIGLTNMPVSIMQLKKSVLLKRIGASPIKTYIFTFVIISYYTLVITLSILWMFIWKLIFFGNPASFSYSFNTISSVFGFIYGNLLNILISLSIGFMIASLSKSQAQAQAIGMIIYFPCTFLSGQFISITTISDSNVMNWISRFLPFRYSTGVIIQSWTTGISQHMNDGIREHLSGSPELLKSLNLPIHSSGVFDLSHPYTFVNPESFTNLYNGKTNQFINVIDFKGDFKDIVKLPFSVPTNNFTPYTVVEKILSLFLPLALSVPPILISIKKFQWSSR